MKETYYQDDKEAIAALLVGHTVIKIDTDTLLLDDGTRLKLKGNEGGCSCGAGDYDLTHLTGGVDNIITNVEFADSPSGDDEPGDGSYRIFVFADERRINLATFEGTDGNGYYGTGYWIQVERPVAS